MENEKRYNQYSAYLKDKFGAKVYKITRDKNNNRETWMKITGGILNVKDVILANGAYENEGEKVNEIRLYSEYIY